MTEEGVLELTKKMVPLEEVLHVLEEAYHPQNPSDWHPADVIWKRFVDVGKG